MHRIGTRNHPTAQTVYLWGKSLKLSWSSAGLRQVCVAEHGLVEAASADADDAKLLLSLAASADGVAQLDALSCVVIDRTGTSIVLRLGAIEIDATEVRPTTEPRQPVHQLASARPGLMIERIRVGGRPLLPWMTREDRT